MASNLLNSDIKKGISYVKSRFPHQGALEYFVHHNPLSALEHLPFFDALKEASSLYQAETFLAEEDFISLYKKGRIKESDVLRHLDNPKYTKGMETIEKKVPFQANSFFLEYLLSYPEIRSQEALNSQIKALPAEEGIIIEKLSRFMENKKSSGEQECKTGSSVLTHRDLLLEEFDIDDSINPLLVAFFSRYFDQGNAYWTLEHRDKGLLICFFELYGKASLFDAPWKKNLAKLIQYGEAHFETPDEMSLFLLQELKISSEILNPYLFALAYRLRGWGAMVLALEKHPYQNHAKECRSDFKAFLLIKLFAECAIVKSHYGEQVPTPALAPVSEMQISLEASMLLSALKKRFTKEDLAPRLSEKDLALIADIPFRLNHFSRRIIWQCSYEDAYYASSLSSLQKNYLLRQKAAPLQSAKFQVFCCLDDREESFRRHIENLEETSETFGVAGHFGLDMKFHSLLGMHALRLCPGSVEAKHQVHEVLSEKAKKRSRLSHFLGLCFKESYVSSRTFFRGTIFSLLLGLFSPVPAFFKIFFPKKEFWFRRYLGSFVKAPSTQLLYAFSDAKKEEAHQYYTLSEMQSIVAGLLKSSGLASGFSPFIFLFGHGSSSLNNPHEAAHDCGACGGGRGGPNARVFALMANRADVREKLAREDKICIPLKTRFIGAYHNTCNDVLTFFDEPDNGEGKNYQAFKKTLIEAAQINAQERCRRFFNVPKEASVKEAFSHVIGRANNICQPRPEYGHATNALCLVGRRHFSRNIFLDRRAFLISYDYSMDEKSAELSFLLEAMTPVVAGISLEYYFSFVDNNHFGCSSKLPHNVTSLLGVMNGHLSDLQLGLPWQMVEIHEPMRLLMLVEAKQESLLFILKQSGVFKQQVENEWIRLAQVDPETGDFFIFEKNKFVPFNANMNSVLFSDDFEKFYKGKHVHLPCVIKENPVSPKVCEVN